MLGPERDQPDEMNKMPHAEFIPLLQTPPLNLGKAAFHSDAANHRIERVVP